MEGGIIYTLTDKHNTMEFTYSDPTKEEGDIFNKELGVLVEKHSMTLVPKPFLTIEGKIDAQIIILKKTPKEDETNTNETSKEETK